MASSEGTLLGIAKQTGKGTPNTTDGDFKYLLFSRGGGGPNNIQIPLDPEVGGGALLRDIVKVGVNSGIQGEMIPRPEMLGFLLFAMTGNVASVQNYNDEAILATTALTGSPQSPAADASPSTATLLQVLSSGGATGSVTINGDTVEGGAADSEIVVMVADDYAATTKNFTSVTSIDLPAGSGSVSVGFLDGTYTHTFTLGSDQFSAPYFTLRYAPGGLWGEQYDDCRFSFASLNFRSPDFVRGAFGVLGIQPQKVTSIASWNAAAQTDGGPQFITPLGRIEVPDGTGLDVLSGSVTMLSNIPLDQQYIVGSYFPQDLDIVNRGYSLDLEVKVVDEDLATKLQYDPDGGDDWVPEIFKEGDIDVYFASPIDAATVKPDNLTSNARPYSVTIAANGSTGQDGNVAWTATPVTVIAQRQVVMNVSGTILAEPSGGEPVTITLINRRASY